MFFVFETGKISGIRAKHAEKSRMQLADLHTAQTIEDMAVPRYRLHKLKGQKKLLWSIRVNKNW